MAGVCMTDSTGLRPHWPDMARAYGTLMLAAACAIGAPSLASAEALDDPQGLALLQKVQNAARQLDYSGTYTYQQGAAMQSSRIVHIVDGTGERERIELLDGEPREFIRHNEVTQCLVPAKKLVIMEHRRGDRFPALILGNGKRIPEFYEIHTGSGGHRIAGRECVLLELVPKDAQRYGYRLCTDTETHLLLKAQVVGPDGVVDQIAFTSLRTGKQVAPEGLAPSWDTKGWKIFESDMAPVDLAKSGWRIPFPPGYEPVLEVSRNIKKASRRVNQLVLTDGLASISVFIEPHRVDKDPPFANEAVSTGAMNIFRTRIGNHWLTSLGEVPAQTVREIAEHTQYVPLAKHQ